MAAGVTVANKSPIYCYFRHRTVYAELSTSRSKERISPLHVHRQRTISSRQWLMCCVCPLPAKFPHISKHRWRRVTIGSSGYGREQVANLLLLRHRRIYAELSTSRSKERISPLHVHRQRTISS
ncbi:hypothetical protein MRX96_041641 [Rhipicephalus microplus]